MESDRHLRNYVPTGGTARIGFAGVPKRNRRPLNEIPERSSLGINSVSMDKE
jgi:hypothetical protein